MPETSRLIAAAFAESPAIGRLVMMLAATGVRLSQVARIRVGGVDQAAGRTWVPPSAKGRAIKPRPPIPVPVAGDVLARLEPVLSGRQPDDLLLVRLDGNGWQAAWEARSAWLRALRAAGLPYRPPYALRHSSIVRQLRGGVPIRFAAAVHDTSVRMVEAHYSAFITTEIEHADVA